MGTQGPTRRGLTLDAGALIAYERYHERLRSLLRRADEQELPVTIPAGALGQVWRDGARQVRLARLVNTEGVEVRSLDEQEAKAAGRLCGRAGTSDLIDASVVLAARTTGSLVLTSDPDDLRRLDPSLPLARL